MKKIAVLWVLSILAVTVFAGCDDSSSKNSDKGPVLSASLNGMYDAGSEYRLVWKDEFDSGSTPQRIDETKWSYSVGVGSAQDGNETGDKFWGNNEWQAYTDRLDNVFLKDGKLHLKLIKEQYHNTYLGQNKMVDFTSGKIHSHNKFHFKFGKIAARIKMPNMGGKLHDPDAQQTDTKLKSARGVWPAFWMLGINQKANDQFPSAETKTWPACGEIDIVEGGFINYGNWVVSSTTHWHNPDVDWYDGVVGIWGIPDHMQWPDDEFYWFENDEGTRGRIHGDGFFNNFVNFDNHETVDQSTGLNVKPFHEDYYVFEFEWTNDELLWYICDADGNRYKMFDMQIDPEDNNQEELAQHYYVIFNLAMGGDATGYRRGEDALSDLIVDTFGENDEMIIDWVRVYQKQGEEDYWTCDAYDGESDNDDNGDNTDNDDSSDDNSGTAGGGDVYADTDDYTAGFEAVTETEALFWFKPESGSSAFVDLHLIRDFQLNYGVPFNASSARYEMAIDFTDGESAEFFITYEKGGLAYDSVSYSYTHLPGQSSDGQDDNNNDDDGTNDGNNGDNGDAGGGDVSIDTEDFTAGMKAVSESSALFYFRSKSGTSAFVDLHLIRNTQLNYGLTYNPTTGRHEMVFDFADGESAEFFITYEKSGLAYDSNRYTYKHLPGQSDDSSDGSSDNTNPQTDIGRIEAESYTDMYGMQLEECSEGTQNIGYIDAGDWIEYLIDVPASGEYTLTYRSASNTYNGEVQFVTGEAVKATTRIPYTGGWQNWTDVKDSVYLEAGVQTVRLNATGYEFNINYFELTVSADDNPVITDGVTVNGRRIMVNGEPFYIKGVCWNPVGVGGTHPAGLDFTGYVRQDATLMQQAGINAVRTYEAITDRAVLDLLYEKGIYVINTVYGWGGNDPSSVVEAVNAVKDHPAILMWCIGNEWNYNGLYVGLSHDDAISKLNQAAALIKANDSTHPVVTVYGHIPSAETINAMPDVDIWGLNMYSELHFNNVFAHWKNLTGKPMFMAEYGADAWNANINAEDTTSQAYAARILTQLLMDNSVVNDSGKVCSGGTIFEWADEWWKDGSGSPSVQDAGGVAPGGGPYPDLTFNEEYWGIVDIYRNPRPAYYELQRIFTQQ
ncbi:MAG: carbohydrate-binding protein [Spirochaetes bacterium]|nr:carbohydrate-binding protein [Spirochaetota bacterium]MBN2769406.1 carbohydrate-binding protein [Spirochaetota bacterium]